MRKPLTATGLAGLLFATSTAWACPGIETGLGPGVDQLVQADLHPFVVSVVAPSLEVTNAKGERVGALRRGRRYVVTELDGQRYRIDWRGRRVWIQGNSGVAERPNTAAEPSTYMVVVNEATAPVLRKPLLATRLGQVKLGQLYALRTIWRNWALIQFDDGFGWVPLDAVHVLERGVLYHRGTRPSSIQGVPGSPAQAPRDGAGFAADETPLDAPQAAKQSAADEAKLKTLKPGFADKIRKILEELKAKGWQPRLAEALRTQAQQAEKVRKGYSKTMRSYHLLGLAVDIIDRRWGWEGPAANTNHAFWNDLGAAAARQNLTWGGNWKSFKDVAHVQARSRSAK